MTLRTLPLAMCLLSCGFAHPSDTQWRPEDLDAYLTKELSAMRCPSISVAVVAKGKVIYAKAFGKADLENDVPATPDTVYRLGSVTKQFTATMIMQLVGEGKLTLDEPLRKVLPEMPEAWDKVTVRHLLTHTSGIKSYTELNGIFADQAMKPTTPAGIVRTVEKEPLDFAPGTKWHYDNTGYELLGMLIEKLDGRPYAESLQVRILTPLGMSRTYFTSEREIVKGRAQGYSPTSHGFRHAAYLNMDWPYAAGSMESTTQDLAKWDAALYGDRILPAASLRQMWTPTTLADGKTERYGFGWQLGNLNGVSIVEHGGGIHGFSTFIRRAPSEGVTVIVLTNSDEADGGTIARAAMGMVDPKLKPAPAKVIADQDPSATRHARETLDALIAGKLDHTKLTPEFNKIVTPELERAAVAQLGALGPITKFELLSSTTRDGMTIRTYQVSFGPTVLTLVMSITEKGLIAGMGIH